MSPAPESANGGGLIAIVLCAIFIAVLALYSGLVDYVVNALPQVN